LFGIVGGERISADDRARRGKKSCVTGVLKKDERQQSKKKKNATSPMLRG